MKILKPLLVLGLVFMAGIAVGVLATRSFVRRVIADSIRDPQTAAAKMDFVRNRMEHDLVSKLDLSPEQRTQVHQIFVDSGEELRTLHSEFQPRVQEVLRNAHGKIAAILTPEQREKFQKITRERMDFGGQQFPRRSPGGPAPFRRPQNSRD